MPVRGIRQCLNDITPYLILIITISTVGSLQFGYHLAELNAPQDVITCHKTQPSPSPTSLPPCIPMSEAAFATISSIFTLGGLLGALTAGPLSSRHGRLPTMRSTALLYTLGSLVESLAPSVPIMSLGRLIAGLGAGASTVIVPIYISEVAPPAERGMFGAMTQVSINVGILLSQTLGYFLSHDSAWRWILATGVCIATAQALGSLLIPESPAWLAANGDVTKAKHTLQKIRGSGFDIKAEVQRWEDTNDDELNEESGLLAQTDGTPHEVGGGFPPSQPVHSGFVQVLRDPHTRPAIIAVVGIMFAQQLCGINSIVMYSVSLLADLLPISSALLTILISVVNLGTTIACSPLPDRFGRKTCLLLSIIGQGSSSLILAVSILYGVKVLSAIAVIFFAAFFAVGLGPVPFIMASELVGTEAVGATQSWALGASYIATFLVAQFFPIVNKALNDVLGGQGWVYFIFAAVAAGSALFISCRVPETRGKKDADEVWGRTHRLD